MPHHLSMPELPLVRGIPRSPDIKYVAVIALVADEVARILLRISAGRSIHAETAVKHFSKDSCRNRLPTTVCLCTNSLNIARMLQGVAPWKASITRSS